MWAKETLSKIDYAQRRKTLLDRLEKVQPAGRPVYSSDLAMTPNVLAIIPAAHELIRNDDVSFAFRQDSNFHYLTGFPEPEAVAVFRRINGKSEFILFTRPKDKTAEVWTGRRIGPEGATKNFGANRAYPIGELESQLTALLKGVDTVFYTYQTPHHKNDLDNLVGRVLQNYKNTQRKLAVGQLPVFDLQPHIGEMRLFKSPAEIERMRRAAEISCKAHAETMARVRPGMHEAEVTALIEYVFGALGADRPAYNTIVASGVNATILHYVDKASRLADGDLLLIDAGAEVDLYAADITRTFPVSGKFTEHQKDIYGAVYNIQTALVDMVRPGMLLKELHDFTLEALIDVLIAFDCLTGSKSNIIKNSLYKKFYMHGTSHYLGLDVHDAGLYIEPHTRDEPRLLAPGMVFTIEPGFYADPDDASTPQAYLGIGVRIEDNILVTVDGHENLTAAAPKSIKDIENIVGTKGTKQNLFN